MLKELILLRHGEAEISRGGRDDAKRELTDEGKRDAQRLGVWLSGRGLLPDQVVTSEAARARTTAEKLCKAGGLSARIVQLSPDLYDASVDTVAEIIQRHEPQSARLMIVGHNPTMANVARRIIRRASMSRHPNFNMTPGTLLRFGNLGDPPRRGEAWCDLLDVVVPRDLPRDFPYPGPEGAERRPRPAYYYQQSAVIPYRTTGDGIEVMLISTQKRKRWLVPKGIHDPGKSPQESAANEAREEAGVLGEVADTSIGSFQVEKWGGTCNVAVFPMRVLRELPESEWEESYRGRCWLPIDEAAEKVSIEELRSLIRSFPSALDAPGRG